MSYCSPTFRSFTQARGCLADEFAVELVEDVSVWAFSVAKDVVLLADLGVRSLGDGSRARISLFADQEMSSGKNGSSTHVTCSRAVNEGRRVVVTGQFLLRTVLQPTAEDPELSKGQGD